MTEPDRPPEQALLKRVAQFHGVTITAIRGRDQTKQLRMARAEAMVRLHYQLGFNFAQIGRLLDNRTFQTVRDVVRDHEAKYGGLEKLREFRQQARTRRVFTDAEIAIAREMNASGTGKAPIARRLRTSIPTLERECARRGIEIIAAHRGGWRRAGTPCSDPVTNVPIGSIPPGHPMYELDQQMLRARNTRPVAVGGWMQSSIADIV